MWHTVGVLIVSLMYWMVFFRYSVLLRSRGVARLDIKWPVICSDLLYFTEQILLAAVL